MLRKTFLATVAMSALLLTGCASTSADRDAAAPGASSCTDAANWMGCMFAQGNLPITAISMPGSHDAATYAIRPENFNLVPPEDGSVYANGCGSVPTGIPKIVTAKWAKTQDGNMGKQAANGSRYFDVRTYWNGSNALSTCHTLEGATFADAMGKNSDFQKFARSHPNEIFILDMQQFFAETGNPSSLLRKESLRNWIDAELGDIVIQRTSADQKLQDVTLASMRNSHRNVIVLTQDDFAISQSQWPRGANLYSEWQDDSDAAKAFWWVNTDFTNKERWPLALAKRELGVLNRAPATGKLNVLNYILDTACPGGGGFAGSCNGRFALWTGTIEQTSDYLLARIPSFTRQIATIGKPAVVMRDVQLTGSNQPIWDLNLAKRD